MNDSDDGTDSPLENSTRRNVKLWWPEEEEDGRDSQTNEPQNVLAPRGLGHKELESTVIIEE